jgi:hypothetical protein
MSALLAPGTATTMVKVIRIRPGRIRAYNGVRLSPAGESRGARRRRHRLIDETVRVMGLGWDGHDEAEQSSVVSDRLIEHRRDAGAASGLTAIPSPRPMVTCRATSRHAAHCPLGSATVTRHGSGSAVPALHRQHNLMPGESVEEVRRGV